MLPAGPTSKLGTASWVSEAGGRLIRKRRAAAVWGSAVTTASPSAKATWVPSGAQVPRRGVPLRAEPSRRRAAPGHLLPVATVRADQPDVALGQVGEHVGVARLRLAACRLLHVARLGLA